MDKERFLTLRWNNLLSLGLGLILLIYVYFVFTTSVISDLIAFVGLLVISAVYWTIVEQHANMRFAWLQDNSTDQISFKEKTANRLIYIAYNLLWWVPAVLAFTNLIDYQTGFLLFLVYTIFRALVNFYRVNFLSLEQALSFPLRSPW